MKIKLLLPILLFVSIPLFSQNKSTLELTDIFNMEFVVIMTGVGIISLAGIVVNNGIVLIDYIDLVRVRKREELGLPKEAFLPHKTQIEALVEAGRTRLR